MIESEFPKLVLVAMASPCNAKCPHCPCTIKPSIRKTEDIFIRHEYFKKIVDECVEHDCHIRMSGYGEPLLHPNFLMLVNYAKDKNAKLSLITNGSLLRASLWEQLVWALESIEVSVDSHKEEIYRKIRVGLDFKTVHNNICDMTRYRDTVKSKMAVMCSIINQPSRNPQINESSEYWGKIVDKVMVRKYVTWGVLPEDDRAKNPDNREPCPYPWERLMIDPAGDIRLCPYDDQKLIPSFGSLQETTIKEAWDSPRMSLIRSNHLQKNFNVCELCNECTDWASRSWDYNYRSALGEVRK